MVSILVWWENPDICIGLGILLVSVWNSWYIYQYESTSRYLYVYEILSSHLVSLSVWIWGISTSVDALLSMVLVLIFEYQWNTWQTELILNLFCTNRGVSIIVKISTRKPPVKQRPDLTISYLKRIIAFTFQTNTQIF